MVQVIALTQFAFLTLGIVMLKILIQANSLSKVSPYLQNLDKISLWLLCIPLLWIAFASVCRHIDKAPLYLPTARIAGVIVAIVCFLFLATVTFLPNL